MAYPTPSECPELLQSHCVAAAMDMTCVKAGLSVGPAGAWVPPGAAPHHPKTESPLAPTRCSHWSLLGGGRGGSRQSGRALREPQLGACPFKGAHSADVFSPRSFVLPSPPTACLEILRRLILSRQFLSLNFFSLFRRLTG